MPASIPLRNHSSCLPLCFSSFDFLKQRLGVSNKAHKLEVIDNVMAFVGMDNEKGELAESALHSNPSLYEQEDNQPRVVQDECYNLFYEECN